MRTNVFLLALCIAGAACHKNNNAGYPSSGPGNYQQTNLVADVAGSGAAMTDPRLLNAWGIAVNPVGIVWIAANHSGTTTVYDSTGKTLLGPVAIPSHGDHFGGSPTGIVFNATTDFVIPCNQKTAKFIFVNEDGTVSAWGGGDSTFTVADRSADNTVYKGLALANDGTGNFLYAADFRGKKIDVYDRSFTFITTKPFVDPDIPAGFSPFNIQNIGGKLYVTYAMLKGPENEDDQPGTGNGYIDIFNPDGSLLKRFASRGALNSPWGLAQAPAGSGLPFHSILVGNFGDGWINVYDSTGFYTGALQSNGQPVIIPGLWALDFPYNEAPLSDPGKLYFTAGPGDEEHGLFGFLKMK
ncbi:TIGR03118 family protein [Flavitalea sp. BT771]|uniref:TIGR03118 family protein n=1 Tax=Flavitalea sp. BT771 TaxID=3063329 RepID=UPI0026E39521|nr:TIGR03118 family protein [Flavitalea sp. BT771]MDO6429089.1 TIGR03118 family protein [Flavitalea sp. BT771]MDV6218783.1 TIGR03118 family protein [Flavitalea sp. BT771]